MKEGEGDLNKNNYRTQNFYPKIFLLQNYLLNSMGLFDRFSTNLERLKTNKDIKGLKKIFLDIKKPPDDRKTALNYLQELGYTPDNLKEKIYKAVLNGEIDKLNSDDESILILASFLDSSDFDHCHPNPIHDEYKLKIIRAL